MLPTASLPADLECQFDQDGNGLDDEIERQIARCLVPEFRFDSAENDNPAGVTALKDDEPNILFSIYRDGADRLVIKYVALWRNDGGFVLDDDWWSGWGCGGANAHEGDAQGFSVQAEIVAGSEAWYAVPLGMSAGGQTTVDGVGAARTELKGSHPIVYPTAGKHHFQPHTSYECSDISDPFTCCWDRADGLGVHVVPGQGRGQVAHVPAQNEPVWTEYEGGDSYPIRVVTDHLFYNVCKFRKDGTKVPPAGFQGNDLGTVGYGGQTLWGHFFSSLVDPAGPQLAQAVELDNDGDGRTDASAFTFDANGTVTGVGLPADRCPWDSNNEDPDGDGLGGACDPDPKYRNKYVAAGSATLPAFRRPSGILSGWLSFHEEQGFTGVAGPRGGFLDSDQDGPVDGEDLCPSMPNGPADLSDSNAWAEQNLFAQDPGAPDLGRFYRGNNCDPYPSTTTRWLDSGEGSAVGGLCSTMSWRSGGSDVVAFAASVGAGVSANTPGPNPVDLRSFVVQNYRCACNGPSNANCVRDPSSPCYRVDATAALPATAQGRGWRPVQREGCVRDAQGFCQSQTRPNRSSQTIRWDWRGEAASLPSHFASGDVVTGNPAGLLGLGHASDVSLQFAYALWTQTLEGASFIAPPGASLNQISVFPEPEKTVIGAPLLNVASAESRRLRASFAEARGLRSPFQTFVGFGAFCAPRPFFCTSCPERPWDPVSILLPRTVSNPGPVRVFRPGATLLTDAAVLAGDSRTVSSVVPTDALHWSSVTPGVGTAVASIGAIASSSAVEPVLVWVEASAVASRWAILEPQASQPNTIAYTATLEGELPTGISSTARLIGDGAGSTFTLFDRTRRTLMAFDPSAVAWIQTPNSPGELFDRTGVTLGLFGSELLAVGGKLGSVVRSDGWIINVLTGNVRSRSFGLPAGDSFQPLTGVLCCS